MQRLYLLLVLSKPFCIWSKMRSRYFHLVVYYWWEMKISAVVCCDVTGGVESSEQEVFIGLHRVYYRRRWRLDGAWAEAPRSVPSCCRVKCHCVRSAHSTHLISSHIQAHQPAVRKETRKSSHKMGRTSTSHLVTCPESLNGHTERHRCEGDWTLTRECGWALPFGVG